MAALRIEDCSRLQLLRGWAERDTRRPTGSLHSVGWSGGSSVDSSHALHSRRWFEEHWTRPPYLMGMMCHDTVTYASSDTCLSTVIFFYTSLLYKLNDTL